jgi:hypothetical protein
MSKKGLGIGAAILALAVALGLSRKTEGSEPGTEPGTNGQVLPPNYSPLSVELVPYPQATAWLVPIVRTNITNPNDQAINPSIKIKLYESYYWEGPITKDLEFNLGTINILAGGNFDLVYDGRTATPTILLESGGGQITINWQLSLEDNLGGKSDIFSFTT